MKTKDKLGNIAVPDVLIKKIKAQAAQRGLSIRDYVTPILEKLATGKAQLAEVAQ